MPEPKQHAPKGRIKARPDTNLSGVQPIKCRAHKKNGQPCGHYPIAGATVCRWHGGAAPQVQKKAEERLLEMQPAAIRRLNELMEQVEFPSVAIAATRDVLDRTMGKALERAEVGKPGDFAHMPDEELKAKLTAILSQL